MDEISLVQGDSSDLYHFSSKQKELLNSWEGSWTISEVHGEEPILSNNLIQNENILNNDAFGDEPFKKTFKTFEPVDGENVRFNDDVVYGEAGLISGKIFTTGKDEEHNIIEVPEANRYITVTLKGTFVSITRTQRLKTDEEGNFSWSVNLGCTVKVPEGSYFIFQISPQESEQLEVGQYFLSVEVRERNTEGVIIFRREIIQSKLKITTQGVE